MSFQLETWPISSEAPHVYFCSPYTHSTWLFIYQIHHSLTHFFFVCLALSTVAQKDTPSELNRQSSRSASYKELSYKEKSKAQLRLIYKIKVKLEPMSSFPDLGFLKSDY